MSFILQILLEVSKHKSADYWETDVAEKGQICK